MRHAGPGDVFTEPCLGGGSLRSICLGPLESLHLSTKIRLMLTQVRARFRLGLGVRVPNVLPQCSLDNTHAGIGWNIAVG